MAEFILNKISDEVTEVKEGNRVIRPSSPAVFEHIRLVKAMDGKGEEVMVQGPREQVSPQVLDAQIIQLEKELARMKTLRAAMIEVKE